MQLKDEISAFLQENFDHYLQILKQMVDINTFTWNAEGVDQLGSFILSTFSHLGFSSELIPSTNPKFGHHLILHRHAIEGDKKSNSSIALISHLDTVFSPEEENKNNFHFRMVGKRAYGPGTVDIKGGSVMILMIMDAIYRYAPHVFDKTNWCLAYNAAEEALSDDFGDSLIRRLPPSTRACLIFEGGATKYNPENDQNLPIDQQTFGLVASRKGRAALKVQVEGKSAHAGNYHAKGANAIVQLAHLIQELNQLTDYEKQVTINIGTIKGGSVINRVPHEAEANLELRAFSPEVFKQTLEKILSLEKSIVVTSRDGFKCKGNVKITEQTAPWPENQSTADLFTLWEKTAQQIGMQVSRDARGGLSDGNFLWDKFPTLDGLGPVGGNAHCSEHAPDGSKEQEYVELESFIPKTLLNTLAIIQLAEQNQ